jgi:GDPmannose 4,6-dehydratase
MKNKKAIITGITGQDGAYLSKLLLSKGYKVYGTFRRLSTPNFWRLNYLNILDKIELIPCDLLDQSSIMDAIKKVKPDEFYNLAAQSFVGASFEQPVATGEISGIGVVRILDTIRHIKPDIKFYQASTSEMFGGKNNSPQSEDTPFVPRSPYAAAKLYAHAVTINYREAYDMFTCCGILFNHESPLRGIEFVTRKITYNLCKIKLGLIEKVELGNLDAKRDWGHAKDYVKAMWKMLQLDAPEEFVISSGKSYSIDDFGKKTAEYLELNWNDCFTQNKKYFRPTEVHELLGNPSKAIEKLKWNPNATTIDYLIKEMVDSDLKILKKIGGTSQDFDESIINEIPHLKE